MIAVFILLEKSDAMNVAKQYWNMLVKGQEDDPDGHRNVFEILDGDKISGFSKKNKTEFLSNFHPSTISFEGQLYPTVEHAYQASKTLDSQIRNMIRKSVSPMDAKKLGRSLTLRDDWADVKVDVMRKLIREKFQNPFLQHLLLQTGDLSLINENRWNDKFWGVCKGVGENWLGRILEEVREEIRNDGL